MSVNTKSKEEQALEELPLKAAGSLVAASFRAKSREQADHLLDRAGGLFSRYAAESGQSPGQAARELVRLHLAFSSDPRVLAAQALDEGQIQGFADKAEMSLAIQSLTSAAREDEALPRDVTVSLSAIRRLDRDGSLTPMAAAVTAEKTALYLAASEESAERFSTLIGDCVKVSVASTQLHHEIQHHEIQRAQPSQKNPRRNERGQAR